MGIFGKQSRAKGQQSATTLIAKGCSINGQLRLENNIQVDGSLAGEIYAEHTMVISETGQLNGEVYADKVVVNGLFEGVCHAASVEILAKGRMSGTIYSDNLSIEPGGKFNGQTYAAPEQQVVELPELKKVAEA